MNAITTYHIPNYQSYTKIFHVQRVLHTLRVARRIGDVMLLLEHAPVITIGRTPDAGTHLLATSEMLQREQIEVVTTNRGGDITYHGPGQLVVYYIMALDAHDVHEFVHALEHSVIALLAQYGILASSRPEYPGVWVQEEKICALGIYVHKWVTMHGIALNVAPRLEHFRFIVPCGIAGKGVTSMQQVYLDQRRAYDLAMDSVKRAYLDQVATTFQAAIAEGDPEFLWRCVADQSDCLRHP
jgi:lipoyl(octanoyl) transferase